jgi:translation elongation factor EF-1beta
MVKSMIKFLLIGLVAITLIACGPKEKTTSVEEINQKIIQVADVSELTKGNNDKLKKLYDISEEEIQDFVLYLPPSNIEASEILVLKVKDEGNLDEIKDKIFQRVDKKSEIFKDYLPEEYYLVEKKILDSNNKYLIFAVHRDWAKIQKAFDECF